MSKKLIVPHITEKAYKAADSSQTVPQYTFKVATSVDKALAKKVIEKEFKVNIIKLQVVNIPGKARKFKGISGRTKDIKKMIVSLKPGQKISSFEIETKEEVKDNSK